MTQSQVMKFHSDLLGLEYVMVDGNPWFKGKEAALMIGYQDTVKAVRIHVDDEDNIKCENLLKTRCVSMGQEEKASLDWTEKNTIYANESGSSSLILRSNKPEAKQFKRWITFTALTSLRKTGQYSVQDDQARFNPQLNNPTGERKLHY